jgi:ABC-2 type transport system permease protein
MAVFEHNYKPYQGELTPSWSRFLVIPRYAYQDIFQSRLVTVYFFASFVYPLACALFIYLHYNISALELLNIPQKMLFPINTDFFYYMVVVQGIFAFFLNLLVGPVLVAKDMSNNALPLYLCRPFSRFEYVFGKMSVLLILFSAMTWLPQILLFGFKAYLAGGSWMIDNYNIAIGILVGNGMWILVLCLLSQAISALIKVRIAASGVLLGIFFVPTIIGAVINELFRTKLGYLISLRDLMRTIWAGLFQHKIRMELPLLDAWVVLIIICAVCLGILLRKVRAYEVVS